MIADRTYWTIRDGGKERAWHACRLTRGVWTVALCGYTSRGYRSSDVVEADRKPVDGHLCNRCAASIAASTDVET